MQILYAGLADGGGGNAGVKHAEAFGILKRVEVRMNDTHLVPVTQQLDDFLHAIGGHGPDVLAVLLGKLGVPSLGEHHHVGQQLAGAVGDADGIARANHVVLHAGLVVSSKLVEGDGLADFKAELLRPVLAVVHTMMHDRHFHVHIVREHGMWDEVDLAVHGCLLFQTALSNSVRQMGVAFLPAVRQRRDQFLIDVAHILRHVDGAPEGDVRHGIGTGPDADLLVVALVFHNPRIPVEVELLADVIIQRVVGVGGAGGQAIRRTGERHVGVVLSHSRRACKEHDERQKQSHKRLTVH